MTDISKHSVVLLSAGVGRRLGKLGISKPKCLLKFKKTTLLEEIIITLQKRKVKEISIILGYFIKITNYKKNGHGCSWHAFKDIWSINRRPILLMHTDIIFNPLYLDNIIKSKKKNIIGIHSNKKKFKEKSFLIQVDNNNQIKNINYKSKIKNPVAEVIGINKISSFTAENIFAFMDKYLVKNNKRLSWEIVISKYIKKTHDSLFILKNQDFFWRNINFESDFLFIKKL